MDKPTCWVIAPSYSASLKTYLQTLIQDSLIQENNKKSNSGSLRCILLSGKLPSNNTLPQCDFVLMTPSTQHMRLTHGTYAFAKQWVDSVMPSIHEHHPNLFVIQNTPYHLQAAFEYTVQMDVARQGAEKILGTIELIESEKPATVFWFDIYFAQPQTMSLLKTLFPTMADVDLRVARLQSKASSDLVCRFKRTVFNVISRLNIIKYAIKKIGSVKSTKQSTEPRYPTVLSYARSDHHLRILEPSLATMKEDGQVVFLDYIRESIKQKKQTLIAETFSDYAHLECVSPRSISLSTELLEALHQSFQNLLKDCPTEWFTERLQLVQFLQKMGKQLARLEAISAVYQPTHVFACMEADAFGLYFIELKKTYHYTLVNHLHGIAPYFYTQHLFQFDLFFIWNELTADIEVADGYCHANSLTVVGTPFWDSQTALKDQIAAPSEVKKILKWKGDSQLIGAYTAPASIGYIDVGLRTEYINTLCDYLDQHRNVKLLIKQHPNESDGVNQAVINARPELTERIKLFESNELPLYDSLFVVDLATAICSSVLMEALFYDVPALALDTTELIRRLGYGLDKIMPLALTVNEAHQWLDDLLHSEAGIHHPVFHDKRKSYYLPEFSKPYTQRIQGEIRKVL